MKAHVILAAHGLPPRDFPPGETREFFALYARAGHSQNPDIPELNRFRELELKMRSWKRTPENDPFYTASLELASYMEKDLLLPVFPAFNEFCAPTIYEALCNSAEQSAERIIVVTSMLTKGGEHAEVDIRSAIDKAAKEYPKIDFVFAFPFPGKDIARFLAEQVKHFNL